ncbi:MAG: hypothetical protein JWO59_371 [Chloroflexi bacterium]|nr:hypothetical protein [Chloroflexota bacterium]
MGLGAPGRLAVRSALTLVLLLLFAPVLRQGVNLAHAAGAVLSVSPTSNLPHGVEAITGRGFDPLTTVTVSVTTSAGSSVAGTLTSDVAGSLNGLVTLPFTLDSGVPNQISAVEGSNGPTASSAVTGISVIPSIGNGQQVSAHLGDVVSLHAIGYAPHDPLTITVNGAAVVLPPNAPPYITGDTGTLDCSIVVPISALPGQGTIVVAGQATGQGQQDSSSVPINVAGAQNLVVTPNPVRAGANVKIAAGGFGPYEQVGLSFGYHDAVSNGATVSASTAMTSAAGTLDTVFPIPVSAGAGTQAVLTARGQSTGLSLGQTVTVLGQPGVVTVPSGAKPGNAIGVAGTGFQPGERVFLSTVLFSTPSAGLVIDPSGSFSSTFTIKGMLAPGVYNIGASGINGDQATARFVISPSAKPHIVVRPALVSPGDSLHVQGSSFLASERVTLSINAVPLTPQDGPITASAAGVFNSTVRVPKLRASGTYVMTAQGMLSGEKVTAQVHVQQAPVSTVYFAEGYTGGGPATRFGESLDVLNTNPITALGKIAYYFANGITQSVSITVPAHARLTEDVGQDVGQNQVVSALVQFDRSVTTTRTITRTTVSGSPLATSISSGEAGLSQYWYFSEGYTGASFQEYLALFNPGDVAAQVMIQTFGASGTSPTAPISRVVPAHTRVTVNMRAIEPNRSFGMLVQSDQGIAAERVLYWGTGSGSSKFSTSVSQGARGPAAVWTFPYVSTSKGDQSFLSLTDPTTVAAHVQLSVYGNNGTQSAPASITVDPGSRLTVALPSKTASANSAVSIVANSDVPIVVEQAQYFGGSPNTGSHSGSIITGPLKAAAGWNFTVSNTDRLTTGDWYVLNTGTKAAQLKATTYDSSGATVTYVRNAPAGRVTKLDLGNSNSAQGVMSTVWSSSAPISILAVLHTADGMESAVVTGDDPGNAGYAG